MKPDERESAMLMETITRPRLSRTEWSAVSIALGDAERPCVPQHAAPESFRGKLRRAYGLLTGNTPPTPLSAPPLEGLRRFC